MDICSRIEGCFYKFSNGSDLTELLKIFYGFLINKKKTINKNSEKASTYFFLLTKEHVSLNK